MNEISVFKIAFDYDLSRLKDLPKDVDKILKEILSNISTQLSEIISKGIEVTVPDIQVKATNDLTTVIADAAIKQLRDIFIDLSVSIFKEKATEEIEKKIGELRTDLEKLEVLKRETEDFLDIASTAKQIVSESGERANSFTIGGLPRDLDEIQQRIDSLNAFLDKLEEVEDELTHGALKSGIPEQPKLTPIPKFGQPGEVIVVPEIDRIKPLVEELNQIIQQGNKLIDERSQLLPSLDNATARLSGTTSTFVNDQTHLTDAFNGSTISAVNLAEKGINPLTGKASELGISLEKLFQNAGEGAVIFGFTKEELEKLSTTTGDVVGANEQLTDTLSTQNDVLEHGSGILELTDEELLSLGDKYAMLSDESGNYTDAARQSANTTADLTGQNSTYAKSQDQVNQSLDNGTVAFDNVGASAEELGETLDKVENQGGFFEGIKQGFIDFVENVQSNSELMADFFADTLSQMSQSFSDLFFNIITGKFDDLKDLAKQAFEAILRAFLDLVSAIVTKQIVISIGGLFGFGKEAGAVGGGNALDIGKQGANAIGSGLGLFGSGGAFSTLGAGLGIGGAGALAPVGTLGGIPIASGASVLGSAPSGALLSPGFFATAGAAITIVGAALAAAALVATIILPLLEKTPRLDIDFDSVKTEAGRRAAIVGELLDPDFLKDEIIDISVKRKAGLGLGGDEGIKDVLADAIQVAVNNLLDIINKLPTDLAETLSEELLNTPLDTETEVAGERLFEFDAKGKKIAEKFNQLINGEIQAKFLFAVDGFLQTMFESLGVLPGAAEAFLDERFEEFKNAGSREARAKVGQELLADINAFVDAFNIVSGNVNDSIGQTIQKEEWEYRLAA